MPKSGESVDKPLRVRITRDHLFAADEYVPSSIQQTLRLGNEQEDEIEAEVQGRYAFRKQKTVRSGLSKKKKTSQDFNFM